MPISVPYISQWDASAHLSRGDCGIVAACMVAQWKNIDTTPDAMLRAAKLPVGRLTYSFLEIIRAASAVGLKLGYGKGATWDVIADELKLGNPVLSLVRYGELAGNQDDFDGAHFVVVTGFDPSGNVYLNDPDFWAPLRQEGAQRKVPLDQFEKAIGAALVETGNQAYQSLFVV